MLGGQFLVALGFAELAAHSPLFGGAYQSDGNSRPLEPATGRVEG